MPRTQGINFVITEVKGWAHIVLKETTKGRVYVEQSMLFHSKEEFDAWYRNEKRRLEYPHLYDQLNRSVSSIFKIF
jgi:hypothetical protein